MSNNPWWPVWCATTAASSPAWKILPSACCSRKTAWCDEAAFHPAYRGWVGYQPVWPGQEIGLTNERSAWEMDLKGEGDLLLEKWTADKRKSLFCELFGVTLEIKE